MIESRWNDGGGHVKMASIVCTGDHSPACLPLSSGLFIVRAIKNRPIAAIDCKLIIFHFRSNLCAGPPTCPPGWFVCLPGCLLASLLIFLIVSNLFALFRRSVAFGRPAEDGSSIFLASVRPLLLFITQRVWTSLSLRVRDSIRLLASGDLSQSKTLFRVQHICVWRNLCTKRPGQTICIHLHV